MDTERSRDANDMTELERRLAGWRPASERLDADAMLFAAGQAAGRRGRGWLIWPACCLLLAVQAVGLGLWGLSERAERLILAQRLDAPAAHPGVSPPANAIAEPGYQPSPDDYLHLRRMMEQDPNHLLVGWRPETSGPIAPPPEPAILTPHEHSRLLQ
jgi:hypothetical protein